jgi:exo-1,4-beta-D-glucosaminidase
VAADSSLKAFKLPQPAGATPTWFAFLQLDDASGRTVSRNVYWLSTKKDALAWDESDWYFTPQSAYADFTALQQLPPAEVAATVRFESGRASVTLQNPSKGLAFLVHLAVRKGAGGEEVLPVLWEDNYVVLLPGETRALAAQYAPKDLGSATPVVTVDGWNIPEVTAR